MHKYDHHIGDYTRDTVGLAMIEDGAYRRLLDQCYASELPLPPERGELYRMARAVSPAERKAVDYVLGRYFVLREDGWHQNRADVEIGEFHGKSDKAKAAADSRWERQRLKHANGHANAHASAHPDADANALRTHPKRMASAMPPASARAQASTLHPPSAVLRPPDEEPSTPDGVVSGKHDAKTEKRGAMQTVAREILAFLNQRAGRKFPPSDSNIGIVVARMKEGFTPTQIRQVVASRIRKWKGDEKMDQFLRPMTLFAKTNFSNYVGELIDVPEGDE